jgi:hypothetical protein
MLPLEYRKSNQCCCYGSRPFFDPDQTFHFDAAPDLDPSVKSYGIYIKKICYILPICHCAGVLFLH